jgi:hypothetical protein
MCLVKLIEEIRTGFPASPLTSRLAFVVAETANLPNLEYVPTLFAAADRPRVGRDLKSRKNSARRPFGVLEA